MAETVMLSAIESMDCWLIKKEESNLEKLYSLIVGMSDLGEQEKEMVHTLLRQIGMELDDEEERERNIKKLYNLMDLNNEKMQILVVGMADFWENHNGKLYFLMFLVDTYDLWGGDVGELKNEKLHRLLIEITDVWGGNEGELKKENLHSLLVEITDLWGDDKRELKKENLHRSLFLMLKKENYSKIICKMSGEVAGLWKDKQPKLNKQKLHTWLANKLDLSEPEYLFSVLHNVVLLYDSIREGVEGAKRGFRMILDLVTDKKSGEESSLRYFIPSDVVDMAHHAQSLIQLEDSDPFALFFQLSVLQALKHQSYYKWFADEFKHIANGLQEIKMKLEKVGRTTVEAVILSAIESMDCWLLKKEESNFEKLYSLIVGMSDLGEEKKEKLHTVLQHFGMMIEEYEHEYNKAKKRAKLYKLLDLKEEKMYNLVVGMADFWEVDKGKLYFLMFLVDTYNPLGGNVEELMKKEKLCRLLIEMTDLWGGDEGELKKKGLHSLLIEITDQWGGDVGDLKKEKLHSLLIEIIDLWGGNKGALNKEKLHRLLVEITDLWGDDERELNKKNLHSLLFQMLNKDNYSKAELWKDKQPKSNKEKLYTWLDNKLDLKQDLRGAKHLFCVLLDMVLLYDSIKEAVEGAKREFRKILDLVTDKKLVEESILRYFILEVVDMAHHAHFLIQLQDSDHFPLFFELLTHQALEHQNYYKWFGKEFKHIANGLQEIKVKVEKAKSNMTEPVIFWAIKSLECWLRKKGGLVEENLEKLYSLIVGMSDLGEQKKKMVYILLLHFGKETFEYERVRNLKKLSYLPVGVSDLGEEETEMLHSLQQLAGSRFRTVETVHIFYNLLDMNKKKIYSLVVRMADFWEDNNDKLYTLLFLVAVLWQDYEGEFYSELFDERAYWRGSDREKLQSFLVEITDLWGDDEGELDKERLHRLLFQMLDRNNYSKKKVMSRISGEVAGLWKDKQPKLIKEKLYTWLANKMALCEPEKLFGVLLYTSSHVHKEIREGVEGAKREFRMILNFITDKKLEEETSLRYFISDVVDMAHDAHSLIQHQDSGPLTLFLELSALDQNQTYYKWFGDKFKHIVNGLQEIKDSMLGSRVERLQNVREMEGSEKVVGLEEDVKSLLRDSYITVIKGMAGIGKTTLARQVYNHTAIAQQFQHRAWVCLSKFFSRKEALVFLIRQVVDSNKLASLEKIECVDYISLKQVLRQQLLEKRYFIVLEDVWDNTTLLQYVMKALPKDKGSRLLLTTRKGNELLLPTRKGSELLLPTLTYYFYNRVHYHKMKSMDADESWRLLLKTLSIEGSAEEFPKPLVAMARKILRKCGGLPLAIKEVGRNWAKERQSGREWEKVIESIDLSETLRALESSYQHWGPKLKSHFLHLAFFKEDATIRASKLVQIWLVMGVLSRFEEKSLSCFNNLLEESIIDVTDMDKEGNIKTCSIHVVFHMLSIRKAEDELNFEILNKDGNNRTSHEPRHRVIYCSREKLMNYSSNQDKHLVSLFLYGGSYIKASDPSYWKHFEQLETLDMEDFGLKILPDAIGKLSELRYLGLRNNYIKEIPHSLTRLKKLEVLDIALNFMVEVEDIIWEMESLRHLYMSDISCQKPLRIDTFEYLQTWTYVSVHNWTYEASRLEMMSLTKLGIQEVDENTNVSKLFASLAMLKRLDFLILKGFRFKSMPSLDNIGILRNLRELKLEGLITRLPSANNFPREIERLSLVNSCLHEDPMPILEKLTFLKYLKLQNAYTGQQMVISHNGFSEIKYLVIKELWNLTNVQIEKGAMKRLKDLEINNCPYLDTLPEDYFPREDMVFKMKTTKKYATRIRESSFISRIKKVDIQP